MLTLILAMLSIIGIIITRRFNHINVFNNTVIGNISNLIGIIYGVFVGLMALYLLNNINYTSEAVLQEGNSLANIYRDSKWLQNPAKEKIQDAIKNYIELVVNVEWPEMKKGRIIDRKAVGYIEDITNVLVNYHSITAGDNLLVQDMFGMIKDLYDSRERRIQLSYAQLNFHIWLVIIIGTLLMIFINYFYVTDFKLHIIMICAVALMTAAIVFILETLDKPFQGEFIIQPHQFQVLLEFIHQEQIPKH